MEERRFRWPLALALALLCAGVCARTSTAPVFAAAQAAREPEYPPVLSPFAAVDTAMRAAADVNADTDVSAAADVPPPAPPAPAPAPAPAPSCTGPPLGYCTAIASNVWESGLAFTCPCAASGSYALPRAVDQVTIGPGWAVTTNLALLRVRQLQLYGGNFIAANPDGSVFVDTLSTASLTSSLLVYGSLFVRNCNSTSSALLTYLYPPSGSVRQWSNYTSAVPSDQSMCPRNGTAALGALSALSYSPLCARFAIYAPELSALPVLLNGSWPFSQVDPQLNATDSGLQFSGAFSVGNFSDTTGVVLIMSGAISGGQTFAVSSASTGPLVVAGLLQLGGAAVVDLRLATLTLDRIDFVADTGSAATVLLRAYAGAITVAGATWSNTTGGTFGGVLGLSAASATPCVVHVQPYPDLVPFGLPPILSDGVDVHVHCASMALVCLYTYLSLSLPSTFATLTVHGVPTYFSGSGALMGVLNFVVPNELNTTLRVGADGPIFVVPTASDATPALQFVCSRATAPTAACAISSLRFKAASSAAQYGTTSFRRTLQVSKQRARVELGGAAAAVNEAAAAGFSAGTASSRVRFVAFGWDTNFVAQSNASFDGVALEWYSDASPAAQNIVAPPKAVRLQTSGDLIVSSEGWLQLLLPQPVTWGSSKALTLAVFQPQINADPCQPPLIGPVALQVTLLQSSVFSPNFTANGNVTSAIPNATASPSIRFGTVGGSRVAVGGGALRLAGPSALQPTLFSGQTELQSGGSVRCGYGAALTNMSFAGDATAIVLEPGCTLLSNTYPYRPVVVQKVGGVQAVASAVSLTGLFSTPTLIEGELQVTTGSALNVTATGSTLSVTGAVRVKQSAVVRLRSIMRVV